MKTLKEFFTGKRQKESLATVPSYGENHVAYHANSNHQTQTTTLYRCPMGCEGDKTYDTPGNCPVCNMRLIPVVQNNSHSHGHEGHGHGHHHGCCG